MVRNYAEFICHASILVLRRFHAQIPSNSQNVKFRSDGKHMVVTTNKSVDSHDLTFAFQAGSYISLLAVGSTQSTPAVSQTS